MKKVERWIVYPVLIVVGILSLISLSQGHPRILGLDYIGAIVGILALLVVFTVGWQIYKTIDIDNKINSMDKRFGEIVNNRISKIQAYINASTEFLQGVTILSNSGTVDYSVAYETFFIALGHYVEADINVENNVDNCIFNMEESVKNIKTFNYSFSFENMNNIHEKIMKSGKLKTEQIEKIVDLKNTVKIHIKKHQNSSLKQTT